MPRKMISRREFLKLSGKLLGGAALTGLAGWEYIHFEAKWIDYNQITLKISKLPPAFEGYKIAHLTDFHFDEFVSPYFLDRVVEKVNRYEPDLVAITGDFIYYGTPSSMDKEISASLNKLRAKDMVAASPGNHDHWVDIRRVEKIASESQMQFLDNKVQAVHRGKDQIFICGIDSHMVGKSKLNLVTSKIPEDSCALLLVHEPDFADLSAPTRKFSLQLSGHSHGGIVKLPFFGPPVLPQYAEKYPEGLYQIEEMYLYTNKGIGTGSYHVRFNCRPEVAVITLESSNSNSG